jgi:hypothetical protein
LAGTSKTADNQSRMRAIFHGRTGSSCSCIGFSGWISLVLRGSFSVAHLCNRLAGWGAAPSCTFRTLSRSTSHLLFADSLRSQAMGGPSPFAERLKIRVPHAFPRSLRKVWEAKLSTTNADHVALSRICFEVESIRHNYANRMPDLLSYAAYGSRLNEPFSLMSRDEDPTSTSNWPGSASQSFFAVL